MAVVDLSRLTIAEMLGDGVLECDCGREHYKAGCEVIVRENALDALGDAATRRGCRAAYIIADTNTYAAAGERAEALLQAAGLTVDRCVFTQSPLVPAEYAVGKAIMCFKPHCDLIVGVGGGTINDLSKIVSNTTGRPYIYVGTAPSMDGFLSSTSSMDLDGVKRSLDSRCPDVVIADISVMKEAPMRMLQAGLGDMIAKYVSLCEWQIAHELLGEYYCDNIARLTRCALDRCMASADGLLRREPAAVQSVVEGLLLAGLSMNFAGCSRPASGMEHYASHLWDMRSLEFGFEKGLHGTNCAVGTVQTLKMYDVLRKYRPDRETALAYVQAFDAEKWNDTLREFLGHGALPLIELEQKEKKYDPEKHRARLEDLIAKWDKLIDIMNRLLPETAYVEQTLKKLGAPTNYADLGLSLDVAKQTMRITKDIRDKYVGTRILWDLGILEEVVDQVFA